jgi:hypothetical protein
MAGASTQLLLFLVSWIDFCVARDREGYDLTLLIYIFYK